MIRAANLAAYIFIGMMVVLVLLTISGCTEKKSEPDLHMFAQLDRTYGGYTQFEDFKESNQ